MEIFSNKDVMAKIKVIENKDELRYSEIPGWGGEMAHASDKAVLLRDTKNKDQWFPYSQLRKAADGLSIYASLWILDQKGF